MQQLSNKVKITRLMNAVAAGTGTQNGTVLDMQGYNGVTFVAAFGTITASSVVTLKAQMNTTSATGTMGDLAGSAITVADTNDNDCAVLDIYRPRERYLRPVITRATANCVIDGVVAIQYDGRSMPTTHDATTVIAGEDHVSPATGTA